MLLSFDNMDGIVDPVAHTPSVPCAAPDELQIGEDASGSVAEDLTAAIVVGGQTFYASLSTFRRSKTLRAYLERASVIAPHWQSHEDGPSKQGDVSEGGGQDVADPSVGADDSFLGSGLVPVLVSGTTPSEKPKSSRIFIDRDPQLFTVVLAYLRNGQLDLPHGAGVDDRAGTGGENSISEERHPPRRSLEGDEIAGNATAAGQGAHGSSLTLAFPLNSLRREFDFYGLEWPSCCMRCGLLFDRSRGSRPGPAASSELQNARSVEATNSGNLRAAEVVEGDSEPRCYFHPGQLVAVDLPLSGANVRPGREGRRHDSQQLYYTCCHRREGAVGCRTGFHLSEEEAVAGLIKLQIRERTASPSSTQQPASLPTVQHNSRENGRASAHVPSEIPVHSASIKREVTEHDTLHSSVALAMRACEAEALRRMQDSVMASTGLAGAGEQVSSVTGLTAADAHTEEQGGDQSDIARRRVGGSEEIVGGNSSDADGPDKRDLFAQNSTVVSPPGSRSDMLYPFACGVVPTAPTNGGTSAELFETASARLSYADSTYSHRSSRDQGLMYVSPYRRQEGDIGSLWQAPGIGHPGAALMTNHQASATPCSTSHLTGAYISPYTLMTPGACGTRSDAAGVVTSLVPAAGYCSHCGSQPSREGPYTPHAGVTPCVVFPVPLYYVPQGTQDRVTAARLHAPAELGAQLRSVEPVQRPQQLYTWGAVGNGDERSQIDQQHELQSYGTLAPMMGQRGEGENVQIYKCPYLDPAAAAACQQKAVGWYTQWARDEQAFMAHQQQHAPHQFLQLQRQTGVYETHVSQLECNAAGMAEHPEVADGSERALGGGMAGYSHLTGQLIAPAASSSSGGSPVGGTRKDAGRTIQGENGVSVPENESVGSRCEDDRRTEGSQGCGEGSGSSSRERDARSRDDSSTGTSNGGCVASGKPESGCASHGREQQVGSFDPSPGVCSDARSTTDEAQFSTLTDTTEDHYVRGQEATRARGTSFYGNSSSRVDENGGGVTPDYTAWGCWQSGDIEDTPTLDCGSVMAADAEVRESPKRAAAGAEGRGGVDEVYADLGDGEGCGKMTVAVAGGLGYSEEMPSGGKGRRARGHVRDGQKGDTQTVGGREVGGGSEQKPGGGRGGGGALNPLFKTKMCPLLKAGLCPKTARRCKFAHALEELRPTAEFYKTQICSFWSMGFCRAGVSCRHAHGAEELKVRPTGPTVGAGSLPGSNKDETKTSHASRVRANRVTGSPPLPSETSTDCGSSSPESGQRYQNACGVGCCDSRGSQCGRVSHQYLDSAGNTTTAERGQNHTGCHCEGRCCEETGKSVFKADETETAQSRLSRRDTDGGLASRPPRDHEAVNGSKDTCSDGLAGDAPENSCCSKFGGEAEGPYHSMHMNACCASMEQPGGSC
ncbi:zinc finger (ccch type) motif-containing protein [Cystoisospora suis]|uniref:Zinc finger (Ccch type) motif-containing protein n=1 Tax=Cystoisospora suis TaxID=483139 RepID=A0A2C6L2F4_9APIC|nr:zinc finger (ccch type) motif-containing protein [Cystoisospora suis]